MLSLAATPLRGLLIVIALGWTSLPAQAQNTTDATGATGATVNVELELVLAIDTSASVDLQEFQVQYRGLAQAFRSDALIGAIEALGGNGIAVMVMQWAGPFSHYVAVPWRRVRNRIEAAAFARAIESAHRAFLIDVTAIGAAIDKAVEHLAENRYAGRRRVIDVSGDGPSNFGPEPAAARDRAVAAGVTVNGLVIVGGNPVLLDHYRDEVIGGPGAFMMRANRFADYPRAIREKLVREIEGPRLSEATPHRHPTTIAERRTTR